MDRKEFLKNLCKTGLCSCVAISLIPKPILIANEATGPAKDWRIDFMQYRFIKLYQIISGNSSKAFRNIIFQELGKECAAQYRSHYSQFAGKYEKLMEMLKEQWLESYDFDKKTGTLTMIGKPTGKCGCPFVEGNPMPAEFCNCTLGHQQEMFSTIFQQDVVASVIESVLRGSDRCSFQVQIKKI